MIIATTAPATTNNHHQQQQQPHGSGAAATSTAASATLFSEQVGHVIELFQGWNDCERAVSLFAVLKRIPFACTKFLQSVIDANLTQLYAGCDQSKQLENNANSVTFVRALHEAYRCLEGGVGGGGSSSNASADLGLNNAGSLFGDAVDEHGGDLGGLLQQRLQRHHIHSHFGNPRLQQQHQQTRRGSGASNASATSSSDTNHKCSAQMPAHHSTASAAGSLPPVASSYDRKEDILCDILQLMPVLAPGNEEAKSAYLDLIPYTVEDAVRGLVNTSLVQQMFSYVLIHPAFSVEDRRSLNKVLRHLEDHIVNTDPNFELFPISPVNTVHSSSRHPSSTMDGTTTTATTTASSSLAGTPGGGTAGSSTTHSTATLSSASAPHIASSSSAAAASVATPSAAARHHWQAIAPPSGGSRSSDTIHWGHNSNHNINSSSGLAASPATAASAGGVRYAQHKASSNPATLNGSAAVAAGTRLSSANGIGSNASDDHHISFSKNGTECTDFEADDTDKSNTQIGFDTLANLTDFLAVPGLLENVTLKTRRSNSLTTAAAAGCIGRSGGSGGGGGGVFVGPVGTIGGGAAIGANSPFEAAATSASAAASAANSSGSTQNLNQFLQLQKPRSFSLSMACTRGAALTSGGGSDTRLHDFRMVQQQYSAAAAAEQAAAAAATVAAMQAFQCDTQQQQRQAVVTPTTTNSGLGAGGGFHRFGVSASASAALSSSSSSSVGNGAVGQQQQQQQQHSLQQQHQPLQPQPQQQQHHVGMSNIGQWLKSLRLHKYVWLFSNISYEQMLAISEDFLQQLNVTKGARHKLVVCIQRLQERHALLAQLEKDLMIGSATLATALDELSGVVLTPMRPVEPYNKLDVGGQFLRVLNLVANTVIFNKHMSAQDEEPVNTLLWILEKAVHNEAFVAHTNQLKEHRYKVARIKAQFPPKAHFVPPAPATTSSVSPSASGGDVALIPPANTAAGTSSSSSSVSSTSSAAAAAAAVASATPAVLVVGGIQQQHQQQQQQQHQLPIELTGASSIGNGSALAVGLPRSRFGPEGHLGGALAPQHDYAELTPTSSLAPWHNYWAATADACSTHSNSASTTPIPDSATTTAHNNNSNPIHVTNIKTYGRNLHLQHVHHIDSDYHSMSSSQFNSTESLDALHHHQQPIYGQQRPYGSFERTVGKPSPSSVIVASPSLLKQAPTFTNNDYFGTAANAGGGGGGSVTAAAGRFSFGAASAASSGCMATSSQNDIHAPFLYQRRGSFSGLTGHQAAATKPRAGALYLKNGTQHLWTQRNEDNDYGGERSNASVQVATTTTNTATPVVAQEHPRTILRRVPLASPSLPNMSVPPPNHHSASSAKPATFGVPVFDASVPPPAFVRRSVQMPKRMSEQNVTANKAAPTAAPPKVELYRPREIRQTPQQNLQPPSNKSAAAAVALPPKPLHVTSKIAAKFNETPIVYVTTPSPTAQPKAASSSLAASSSSLTDFPALGTTEPKSKATSSPASAAAAPTVRYNILQKTEPAQIDTTPVASSCATTTTLYQTPPSSQLATKSLASIVRTTLPKLMQQANQQQASHTRAMAPHPAIDATNNSNGNGAVPRPGMSNVNVWLKSLRLHKYQWLFADMTYAQMLAIDEAYLERQQITKGARNKLALSVQRLRERFDLLDGVERDLQNGSALLVTALDELLAVAQTPMQPMQPFVGGDVATKLMKVLNMVFEKMSRSPLLRPDDQCVSKLGWLLEVTMHSEGCAALQAQLKRMRQRLGAEAKKSATQQQQQHHYHGGAFTMGTTTARSMC